MSDSANCNERPDLMELAVKIVSAYVSNNSVASADMQQLLHDVHATLSQIGRAPVSGPRPEPAVPIRKSVQQDFIVCLEDGKRVKLLKRYLRRVYHMSPDDYRERWGLPKNYPMVAPAYAEKRSRLAKENGLGVKGTPGRRRRGKDIPANDAGVKQVA